MDNLFTVFLILVFVLGPILEGMKKKEKERQRRQQKPLPPAPEPEPRSSTEEISTKPRDAAAGMIPDDLWAVLTGEQRPAPQVPAPLPRPRPTKKQPWDVVYIPPEETEDEEEDFTEHVASETRPVPRTPSHWDAGARQKEFDELTLEVTKPHIISLETPFPSGAARHSAFHRKVDQPAPPVVVQQARKEMLGLATRSELQRAFVLQEILGRPRGLE